MSATGDDIMTPPEMAGWNRLSIGLGIAAPLSDAGSMTTHISYDG
jgi:hypothetical protein